VPIEAPFDDWKGFCHIETDLPVRVGVCPSHLEHIAQRRAHDIMSVKHPTLTLVAREVTLGDLSIDLLYQTKSGKYYVIEAKNRCPSKAKQQSHERYQKLSSKGLDLLGYGWYTIAQGLRIRFLKGAEE